MTLAQRNAKQYNYLTQTETSFISFYYVFTGIGWQNVISLTQHDGKGMPLV